MNTPARYALGILLVVAVLLLTGAFYVLEEGQQAVVLQFGRPVGAAVTEAGLHFKVPFIQEVRRFEKRLLIWDGDPNQIPTAGREFIWVDSTARWRIVDPLKFLESVATEAGAQSRLDDIIDSVLRDLVSSNTLVELVRSSSWQTPQPGRSKKHRRKWLKS
jgi:modulator of FtsH protease HflC